MEMPVYYEYIWLVLKKLRQYITTKLHTICNYLGTVSTLQQHYINNNFHTEAFNAYEGLFATCKK